MQSTLKKLFQDPSAAVITDQHQWSSKCADGCSPSRFNNVRTLPLMALGDFFFPPFAAFDPRVGLSLATEL